jgi:hypothetical protein
MSLIFRIKSVGIKNMQDDDARKWLEDRNLRSHYSNLKQNRVDQDGYTIFQQKSKTNKVDQNQTTKVMIDDNIFMIGEYRNPKYKKLRMKRGSKKKSDEMV